MRAPSILLLGLVGILAAACDPAIDVEGGDPVGECLSASRTIATAYASDEYSNGSTQPSDLPNNHVDSAIAQCLTRYTSLNRNDEQCTSSQYCPEVCEKASLMSREAAFCVAETHGITGSNLAAHIEFVTGDPIEFGRIVWIVEDAQRTRAVLDARTGYKITFAPP